MANEKTCAARVERLRALMASRGYDAVVLRNNPDLRWLTGAARTLDDEVAHTAIVTPERLLLHTDSRYYNTFRERLGEDSAWEIDEEALSHPDWAAERIGELRARVVAIEDTVSLAFHDALKASLAARSLAALLPRLHGDIVGLRAVKDAEEVELLRAAQRVSDAAFAHICDFIAPGLTEAEVRAELEGFMLSHGADGLSFATIVASGSNGANPHAQPGPRKICPGDFVVMDYGAVVGDYHADMTRTVAVGEPTAEQRQVYDTVRRAHEECAAMARAGVIGSEVYAHSMQVIADAGYGEFYKHSLGHGVGLEIHEQPNFSKRNDKPIPAGAVITIEPGIYLPGRFGVRLEDCGLVSEEGYEPFATSTHEMVVIDC